MTKKKGKKLPGARQRHTKEEVEQFLEDSMGSIAQAASLAGVPYTTFYNWMEKYDVKAYPDKIKRRIAMMALERAKYLALTPAKVLKANGEKQSVTLLQDILGKWGKHIEYTEPVQTDTFNGELKEFIDYLKDKYSPQKAAPQVAPEDEPESEE